MGAWMRSMGHAPDLAPLSLRAIRDDEEQTIWHMAATEGRTWHEAASDSTGEGGLTYVCEFLKSIGLLDMIDEPDGVGETPLHYAINSTILHGAKGYFSQEETEVAD